MQQRVDECDHGRPMCIEAERRASTVEHVVPITREIRRGAGHPVELACACVIAGPFCGGPERTASPKDEGELMRPIATRVEEHLRAAVLRVQMLEQPSGGNRTYAGNQLRARHRLCNQHRARDKPPRLAASRRRWPAVGDVDVGCAARQYQAADERGRQLAGSGHTGFPMSSGIASINAKITASSVQIVSPTRRKLQRWIFTGGSWKGSSCRNSACTSRPCALMRRRSCEGIVRPRVAANASAISSSVKNPRARP